MVRAPRAVLLILVVLHAARRVVPERFLHGRPDQTFERVAELTYLLARLRAFCFIRNLPVLPDDKLWRARRYLYRSPYRALNANAIPAKPRRAKASMKTAICSRLPKRRPISG
jgi:hypothetical protein